MNELWHFEQDIDGGWQWVHTDLESGEVDRSASIFRTRSACMVDALGNGYVCSVRPLTARRTATVH
jgi:hypothetical protein